MNGDCNGVEMAAGDYTHRLRLGTLFVSHAESGIIRPCPKRLTKAKISGKPWYFELVPPSSREPIPF